MRKSNAVLHDEIASTCIGAFRGPEKPPQFSGESPAFYDVCRLAHHYENKGWLRRAIEIWGLVFDLNDNAYTQKYAMDGKDRCYRALKKAAALRKTDESEGATGVIVEIDLDELEAQWD
ncbi:hypothetical protein [Limnobaculum xujianqingii]|uniref:hypothetical protein n=1 Tax=Limnobaculum xujianqingii TaxID=2738837 RepID=UPI0011290362|nr:hypothetical protein [Limnobaculum xujianqingii]